MFIFLYLFGGVIYHCCLWFMLRLRWPAIVALVCLIKVLCGFQ